MSILMMSDLLADLSAEQQQLLAGGQAAEDEDDFLSGQGPRRDRDEDLTSRTKVYRIRKTSRSLIRVERVS